MSKLGTNCLQKTDQELFKAFYLLLYAYVQHACDCIFCSQLGIFDQIRK